MMTDTLGVLAKLLSVPKDLEWGIPRQSHLSCSLHPLLPSSSEVPEEMETLQKAVDVSMDECYDDRGNGEEESEAERMGIELVIAQVLTKPRDRKERSRFSPSPKATTGRCT